MGRVQEKSTSPNSPSRIPLHGDRGTWNKIKICIVQDRKSPAIQFLNKSSKADSTESDLSPETVWNGMNFILSISSKDRRLFFQPSQAAITLPIPEPWQEFAAQPPQRALLGAKAGRWRFRERWCKTCSQEVKPSVSQTTLSKDAGALSNILVSD